MSIRIFFEPRDLWVGVFWDHRGKQGWFVYVCLVPCLPILIRWGGANGTS